MTGRPPADEQAVRGRLSAPERRAQVLEVARRVLSNRGFHGTTMTDIAVAAGVTKPVLYQHFASKRDLYRTVLEDIGRRLEAAVIEGASAAPTPRARAEAGILTEDHIASQINARGTATGLLRRYELQGAADERWEHLSGGQQARFQILQLELGGATLLLLDEPTDNLDVASAEALEAGLAAFQGTVLAVSHDRWFLRSFDHFLIFDGDGEIHHDDSPDRAWAPEATRPG